MANSPPTTTDGPIVWRTSRVGIALGIALVGGAAALVWLFFRRWTLSIGGITLPSWSLLVAAALGGGTGLLMVLGARGVPHCRNCRREMMPGQLPLALQVQGEAEAALAERDGATLVALAAPPNTAADTVLYADYCPKCRQVALVRLGSRPDASADVFQGPDAEELVRAFATVPSI